MAEVQDVRGSPSFENSETEFQVLKVCSPRRRGGSSVGEGAWPKNVLWQAEEKWKATDWRLPFGGQHDNEHVLRGMMWADNY